LDEAHAFSAVVSFGSSEGNSVSMQTEKKDLDKKEKAIGFEHGSSCLATPVTVVLKEKKGLEFRL
jgi:hypothetical protein